MHSTPNRPHRISLHESNEERDLISTVKLLSEHDLNGHDHCVSLHILAQILGPAGFFSSLYFFPSDTLFLEFYLY